MSGEKKRENLQNLTSAKMNAKGRFLLFLQNKEVMDSVNQINIQNSD